MYFVDRKQIINTLDYMDSILKELGQQDSYYTFLQKLALERMTHTLIESVLDVGNMMIDGFIMRDPGGFDDIIDILVDEKVVPEPEQETYKEMIQLREMVVKNYVSVDHTFLSETLMKNKSILEKYSTHIKSYLNDELGVVNAFSNNE